MHTVIKICTSCAIFKNSSIIWFIVDPHFIEYLNLFNIKVLEYKWGSEHVLPILVKLDPFFIQLLMMLMLLPIIQWISVENDLLKLGINGVFLFFKDQFVI